MSKIILSSLITGWASINKNLSGLNDFILAIWSPSSNILNEPFTFKAVASISSSNFIWDESVELIVLPAIWIVPNTWVAPVAVMFTTPRFPVAVMFTTPVIFPVTVKLFGIVTSFAKLTVNISGDDTTAFNWFDVPNTLKVCPEPTACIVELTSSINQPAAACTTELISFTAPITLVAD